jgi:hypothetical protein
MACAGDKICVWQEKYNQSSAQKKKGKGDDEND